MAYLIRTGSGRNDIEFSGDSDVAGRYLKRTGSGIEDINYVDITTDNDSIAILGLNRTGTGRNDIDWQNLTFSFAPDYESYVREMFDPLIKHNAKFIVRLKNSTVPQYSTSPAILIERASGSMSYYTVSSSELSGIYLNTDLKVREMVISHNDQNVLNTLKDHFDNYKNNSNYKVSIRYSQSEPGFGSNDPVNTNYLYLKDVYLSTKYTGSNALILVWSQSPTAMYGNIYIHSSFAIYIDI